MQDLKFNQEYKTRCGESLALVAEDEYAWWKADTSCKSAPVPQGKTCGAGSTGSDFLGYTLINRQFVLQIDDLFIMFAA